MKSFEYLAKVCALLAGALMTLITLVTCASLLGRNTTGASLVGDYELTAVSTGVAVALFMPWAQMRRGHIIVDFFTAKASSVAKSGMDRLGALLVALMMALLAWRTTIGAINSYQSQTTTMMLGFPEWVAYAGMVPPLVLAALIGLAQAAGRGAEGEAA